MITTTKGNVKMNARGLIELLEDLDPETEIRIAQQPSWPFEYAIESVVEIGPSDHCTECGYEWPVHAEKGCDETQPEDPFDAVPVAYIVEGDQLAYLPGDVSEAIGWR